MTGINYKNLVGRKFTIIQSSRTKINSVYLLNPEAIVLVFTKKTICTTKEKTSAHCSTIKTEFLTGGIVKEYYAIICCPLQAEFGETRSKRNAGIYRWSSGSSFSPSKRLTILDVRSVKLPWKPIKMRRTQLRHALFFSHRRLLRFLITTQSR